ncbi:MAG: PAS domain S-box protein [Chloroflexi bacterium]|nr:MAG: PAS domain S-box protein [Chloroflexota bacterium]
MQIPEKPVWRILLIDDDEDDYLLTKSLLSETKGRECKLEWASSFRSGWQALEAKCYDVVLVDYDLGITNGLELIRLFISREYPTPFILLTGRGSIEVDVEAMHAGATLYLTKSEVNPLLLERSIRYAIEHKQIQKELAKANNGLLIQQRELQRQNEMLREEIAERKRVEEAFLSKEAALRGVLDATKESIWLFEPDGTILLGNETAFSRLKMPPEMALGKDISHLWSADIAQPRFAHLREVVETGQPVEFEDERSGTHFLHSYYPVKDIEGTVTSVAAFSHDITKIKQAENKFQAAHQRTIEILESIGDAFYSLDEHFCFTYINRQAGTIWGKVPNDLVGKKIWDVFPMFTKTEAYSKIIRAMKDRNQDQFETYSAYLDQWVDVHLYPTDHGLSVYFQDITRRKHLERDIQKLGELR